PNMSQGFSSSPEGMPRAGSDVTADVDIAAAFGRNLDVANLAFIEQLYYQYAADPQSVEPAWREKFARLAPAPVAPPVAFERSIFASRSGPSAAADARGALPDATASNGSAAQAGNGHAAVAALVAAAAPLIRKTSSVSAERVQRLVE